jgi:hypothetical protein
MREILIVGILTLLLAFSGSASSSDIHTGELKLWHGEDDKDTYSDYFQNEEPLVNDTIIIKITLTDTPKSSIDFSISLLFWISNINSNKAMWNNEFKEIDEDTRSVILSYTVTEEGCYDATFSVSLDAEISDHTYILEYSYTWNGNLDEWSVDESSLDFQIHSALFSVLIIGLISQKYKRSYRH